MPAVGENHYDVTKPLDEPLRVTHFLWELDIVIDQVISRPRASAEACCEVDGDSELRRAVRETRQINNADGRLPLSVNDDVE